MRRLWITLLGLAACRRTTNTIRYVDQSALAIVGTVQRSLAGAALGPGAGCEVRAVRLQTDAYESPRSVPDRVTRADNEGRFTITGTLADSDYYVFAICEDGWGGFGGREITEGRGGQVDLIVQPGYAVAGVVRDAAGHPLEGVDVRITQQLGRYVRQPYSPRMQTGADGRYHFGGLRSDFYLSASLGQRHTESLQIPKPGTIADGVARIDLDLTL